MIIRQMSGPQPGNYKPGTYGYGIYDRLRYKRRDSQDTDFHKSEPKFEVTEVSGNLKQGESRVINVTYMNTREEVAQDATARIIVMTPLSTQKSMVRLGDIGPGKAGLPASRLLRPGKLL